MTDIAVTLYRWERERDKAGEVERYLCKHLYIFCNSISFNAPFLSSPPNFVPKKCKLSVPWSRRRYRYTSQHVSTGLRAHRACTTVQGRWGIRNQSQTSTFESAPAGNYMNPENEAETKRERLVVSRLKDDANYSSNAMYHHRYSFPTIVFTVSLLEGAWVQGGVRFWHR